MNNSKLVNVLRTFSKSEMVEFEKLVASPFFNKGRNYLPFLLELKKFYPKFDDDKLTPEHMYSKIYHGKKFNRQIMWNATSSLLTMAEEFLMIAALKENKFIKNQQIAAELQHRKLSQHFLKKIEEMKKALNNSKINRDYFLFRKQLESAMKGYYYLEEKQRLMPPHTVKQGEYAFLFFLWTVVEVVNDIQVYSYMFNTTFDLNLVNEFIKNFQFKNIINYCKEKKYGYLWLMEMYYNQIMMTIEPDKSEYFLMLKELFERNYEKFADAEKLNWVTCLINYCGYKTDETSRKILFEIHKFELREGLAFTGKYLAKSHYLQILKNAIAINETEWTKSFIEEFASKLKPTHQKPMQSLGYAFVHLKLKDYEMVHVNLSKNKFADPKDKLAVKIIYIKTYYELNETETLFYHIDSTFHFIKYNQKLIPNDIKANYNKCFKLLKQLMTAKVNNDSLKLEEISMTVRKNKDLILGDWLIEKIEELEKKKAG